MGEGFRTVDVRRAARANGGLTVNNPAYSVCAVVTPVQHIAQPTAVLASRPQWLVKVACFNISRCIRGCSSCEDGRAIARMLAALSHTPSLMTQKHAYAATSCPRARFLPYIRRRSEWTYSFDTVRERLLPCWALVAVISGILTNHRELQLPRRASVLAEVVNCAETDGSLDPDDEYATQARRGSERPPRAPDRLSGSAPPSP